MKLQLDMKKLKRYCTMSEVSICHRFRSDKNFIELSNGLFMRDNGAKILAVAHLDVSHSIENRNFFEHGILKGEQYVFSPFLDDRLGVFVIQELLPQMGVECDILFTTGEESMSSTARDFCLLVGDTPLRYNWIVEFDRRGEDVVTYEYDNVKMNKALRSAGFKIGWGTFSDISEMEDLKISCFNVGIGYHNEHTIKCHAFISELKRQLNKFKRFYNQNKNRKFEHTPIGNSWHRAKWYGRGKYNDWFNDDRVTAWEWDNETMSYLPLNGADSHRQKKYDPYYRTKQNSDDGDIFHNEIHQEIQKGGKTPVVDMTDEEYIDHLCDKYGTVDRTIWEDYVYGRDYSYTRYADLVEESSKKKINGDKK